LHHHGALLTRLALAALQAADEHEVAVARGHERRQHCGLNRLACATLELGVKAQRLQGLQGLPHAEALRLPGFVKAGELVFELLQLQMQVVQPAVELEQG
jgi:hypothetical protein